MKCFVILSHLRSNLGEVYLCHKNDEVFVSHFSNHLDMDNILWNSEDVPEKYQEYIVESAIAD